MENLRDHIRIRLLFVSLCLRVMSHHAAALSFNYDFSIRANLESPDLKYINDSSPAGDRIDLTNGTQHNSTGRVFHGQPVRLWNGRKRASFTTSFTFAIGGNHSNERGDGMAFFIGPPSLPSDSRSMFLGLFANSSSSPPQTVGVEFDTCRNDGWDPPASITDHIGIDINNISSANYTSLPNLGLYGTMSANITYDAGSTMMTVSLLSNGSSYSVVAPVDFRDAGVPQDAYVGFSAATGFLTESHQLLSWSFSSTDPSSNNTLWAIFMSVACASLLGLIAALLWIVKRPPPPRPPMVIPLPVARKFSYQELSLATGNFSEDRIIGAGAFGEVYRGVLDDPGTPPVAVKKLTRILEQTMRDYVTEIKTLCQLSHRNMVRLVGWCDGGGNDKLLLVYELVTNGSLDEHLHGAEKLLAWPERYEIVRGIGSAIEYLHTGYNNPILHRDIKPSNVMLDDAFQAKLGDFGLVRQVWSGQGSLRDTAMVGSWDYMDPTCITTGTVSTASDMYSFGVLLLEVATGTKPVTLPDQEKGYPTNTLVNVVRRSYGIGAVLEMADKRLNGDFDRAQMERVLLVGLLCVHEDRQNRPGIRDAVNLLSNLGHPW
ncbi:hypothetical protein EJB05_45058 [Eragrostis curvula]|uniref:non-specific serine/threonine protein kinase n=1 Tax=Eragrostis curvula TaxID=38414 RepID=A0A5J9TJC1_9POAL|nr:hypothetical protein EJB05_45058 [Eragrostis curvula]